MIRILITNNFCHLTGLKKETLKLYKAYKFRHPNAWHLRAYMPKGWDGMIEAIKDSGKFPTGLLSSVVKTCEEMGIETFLKDNRIDKEGFKGKIPKSFKTMARDYQLEAVNALVKNRVKKIRFPRGAIKAATNAGKTIISSGIHLAYNTKTIFLMNSAELFQDALIELPKLIGEPVGQISSKKIEWKDFMVVMVSTAKNRMVDHKFKNKLAEYRVLIADEGDLADNKTYKTVINGLYNTIVRVALSGTIFVSKLAKDRPKNTNLEGFFGPMIYEISNRTLIDKGWSSEVQVKFVRGNKDKEFVGSWQEEYEELIVKNKVRNKKSLKRSKYHWDRGRRSQLIIGQRHEHIEALYKLYRKNYPKDVKIEWVHHERKDRLAISQKFMDGEIDILIGSMILKRGKNFKKMNYMQNAGGGKGIENILQVLGRAFRGCKHYEDYWDEGEYLKKHSRRRAMTYRKEKIEVINKYK